MKTLKTLLFAATSFVLLTGYAGGCGDRSVESRTKRIERYVSAELDDAMDDIDASDQQRARAFAIKDELMKDAPAMIEAQDRAKMTLYQQWNTERADRALIHGLIDQRTKALSGFVHKLADGVIEIHDMLNAEQRKEILGMWH